jgi:two-component system, OmpR family, sensor histidine kinase KdpD
MLARVGRIARGLNFAGALAGVLFVTYVMRAIDVVNATTVGFAYLITVLLVAASWGLAESVVASIAATICFNYFFLPPVGTWTIEDPENWVALLSFLVTSLIASQLSDRAKRRTLEARSRQIEMERLYALSRAIMLMDSTRPVGSHIARELARTFDIPAVAIYDRTNDTVHYGGSEDMTHSQAGLREIAVTGSPPKDNEMRGLFAPISLGGQSIGSLAIQGMEISNTALHAILNLVAISLENARSREIATRAEAARQSEEFKSTLLDGLAHEFKTPLTSIRGATTALLSSSISDPDHRHELLSIVDQEAERLSGLVTETTHLARIEAGKLQLNRCRHSIGSLIEAALEKMESRRDGRAIQVSVAPDLPQVAIDVELMQLALKQLVDNAIKYSPPASPIRISAQRSKENILITIRNPSEPLSETERSRIFDKFYRGMNVRHQVAGTGMGLSIAREILLAHGGDIRLSGSEQHMEFVMSLPLQAAESMI